MPAIDPFKLGVRRPSVVSDSKSFTVKRFDADGALIDVTLALNLRGLDTADEYSAQDQAFGFARTYCPSDGSIPSLIEFDERPIEMSFQLCDAVARILVAQEGGDRYTFEQLCAWTVILGQEWYAVVKWAASLDAKVKDQGKALKSD